MLVYKKVVLLVCFSMLTNLKGKEKRRKQWKILLHLKVLKTHVYLLFNHKIKYSEIQDEAGRRSMHYDKQIFFHHLKDHHF